MSALCAAAPPKHERDGRGATSEQRGQAVIQGIRSCGGAECPPSRTAASEAVSGANAPQNALPPAAPAADVAQVQDAVARINRTVQSLVTHLEFSIDTDTSRNVVRVIDNRTQEILRQFPSEEVLQIAKALDNFTGLLLKDQA